MVIGEVAKSAAQQSNARDMGRGMRGLCIRQGEEGASSSRQGEITCRKKQQKPGKGERLDNGHGNEGRGEGEGKRHGESCWR